jgi:DNA-binding NarL/FixJ family response regulator
VRRVLEASDTLRAAGSWCSFDEATADWDRVRPDAAIVDPDLLGEDPVDALGGLAAGSGVPVLLFSRRVGLDYVHLLVRAGAHGVVGTDASAATLLAATRAVAELDRYLPADLLAAVTARIGMLEHGGPAPAQLGAVA